MVTNPPLILSQSGGCYHLTIIIEKTLPKNYTYIFEECNERELPPFYLLELADSDSIKKWISAYSSVNQENLTLRDIKKGAKRYIVQYVYKCHHNVKRRTACETKKNEGNSCEVSRPI